MCSTTSVNSGSTVGGACSIRSLMTSCAISCLVQVGCHGVLAEAAMRGHVSMVKTLCQKYHCDPEAAVKVQYTANTGCSKRENL